ncbi:MAG: alginate lyase family protein [Mangrovibacterium sp.]
MNSVNNIIHIICIIVSMAVTLGCSAEDVSARRSNSHEKIAGPLPTSAAFIHPGIMNSRQSLDFIRSQTISGDQICLMGYQKVVDFVDANPTPTSFPSVVYVKASGGTPTEDQIRRDAILAYACALRWAKTRDVAYAVKAKNILNGWAYNFQRYDVVSGTQEKQTWLEASWIAPTFAAAADIIAYYKEDSPESAGWSEADISQFRSFLNNLKNNYINKLVESVDAGNNYSNWGVTAGYAKMALGVFLNSSSVYEDGKRIILKLLPIVISSTGEVAELCSRDCGHPQYSMSAFSYAAEIARRQGDNSIYEANSQRIRIGWEWIGKAFAGQIDCRDCSSSSVHAGIEAANNYYSSSLIITLRNRDAPYGVRSDHTFLGFTSYTHYNIDSY